jgi:hypothetical protein
LEVPLDLDLRGAYFQHRLSNRLLK